MRFDVIEYKPCFQGYIRELYLISFVSAKKIVTHDEEILLLTPSMLRVVDNHINSRYCIFLDT